MSNTSIKIIQLGKLYKLYQKPIDKIFDAFGLNFFIKRNNREFWALRGIDLEIKQGERVGLIGRNGAGKSTLLKLIIGNVSPTEGDIKVTGNIQALMELGTGFHPEFTGRQNIRASLAYYGFSNKQIDELEEEIIDFSELDEFIDQPVKTYSAGMYARLGFSTATVIHPQILIIDEVLGAGDAYFAGKCVERMRRLTKETGATVLFVSHDLDSVLQLCERVIWIDRGKVRADGNPLEVIKQYTAMVRKEEEARLKARDLKVLKKHAVVLNKQEEIYKNLLFHFICENGESPSKVNRVNKISLYSKNNEIGTIEVGWPMDNVPEQQHYIIDTVGYMNWGPSKKDKAGMYREIANFNGKYNHAPFEFAIPKALFEQEDSFTLKIDAAINEALIVGVYDGEQYVPLKKLDDLKTTNFEFQLQTDIFKKLLIENEPSVFDLNDLNNEFDNDYGTKEVRIKNVKLLDHLNNETKILESEHSMKVIIDYESSDSSINPVFVFCVYLPDGKCATQWIADDSIYGEYDFSKKGKFIFSIDMLLLGKGSYVASVGIFKNLNKNGLEAQSFHVLDRSIHFEIVSNVTDKIDRGLCLQPFKVELLYD